MSLRIPMAAAVLVASLSPLLAYHPESDAQALEPLAARKVDQEHALRAGTRQLAVDFWVWLVQGGREPQLQETEIESFCAGLGNLELTAHNPSDALVLQHFRMELGQRQVQRSGRIVRIAPDGNADLLLDRLVEIVHSRALAVAWPQERFAGAFSRQDLERDYLTFRNYVAWLEWQGREHGRGGRRPSGSGSGPQTPPGQALDAAYQRWLVMGRWYRKGMSGPQGPFSIPMAAPLSRVPPGTSSGVLGTGS